MAFGKNNHCGGRVGGGFLNQNSLTSFMMDLKAIWGLFFFVSPPLICLTFKWVPWHIIKGVSGTNLCLQDSHSNCKGSLKTDTKQTADGPSQTYSNHFSPTEMPDSVQWPENQQPHWKFNDTALWILPISGQPPGLVWKGKLLIPQQNNKGPIW